MKKISKKLFNYIGKNRIGVLSLVMPNGMVDGAVMHFAHTENPLHIIFSTDKNSRKHQAFESPAVNASFVIGFSEKKFTTMQMEGNAIVIHDEANLAEAKKVYYSKFPNAQKYENDPDTCFIAFSPISIRLTDYKKDPPKVTDWQAEIK